MFALVMLIVIAEALRALLHVDTPGVLQHIGDFDNAFFIVIAPQTIALAFRPRFRYRRPLLIASVIAAVCVVIAVETHDWGAWAGVPDMLDIPAGIAGALWGWLYERNG